MSFAVALGVILVATLLGALCSGLETGMYAYDTLENDRHGRLRRILSRPEGFVIACLIGNNLTVSFATLAFASLLLDWGVESSYHHTAEALVLTPWLFLFSEVFPKSLFQARARQYLPVFTWYLDFMRILFLPVIVILQGLTRGLMAVLGVRRRQASVVNRKRLAWLMQDDEGGLSQDQTRMATNVFELKERRVTSVMEPCRSSARISVSATIDQARRQFLTSEFGFLVVFDKKPENVLGIVYMNQVLLSENSGDLRDLVVPVPEISAKSSLTAALATLRESSAPVARVTGTKGGVIGLLFTRRVVQQIVGELQIW